MLNISTKQISVLFALFFPILLSAKESLLKEDNVTDLIMEAKKKVYFNKAEEARQLYLKALKIDSTCDACYYDLANLYFGAKKNQHAYRMASRAYNLDSTNSWYTIMYARLSYLNRDFEAAEKLFEKLLKKERNSQETWMNLSTIYEETGNLDRALNLIDSIERRFGPSDNLSYRRYDLHMRLGNYADALKEAKSLAESNSDDVRFITILADTYVYTGNNSKALATYDQALEMDAKFYPAAIGKAETYRKAGQFELFFKSLQLLMANSQIESKSKAEYLGMLLKIPSFAQYFKKDLDTIFAITLSVSPTSTELLYLQAIYFMQTDRQTDALALLRTILGMDNKNLEAQGSLLSILHSMNMWNDLIKETSTAISLFPYYSNFYMIQAITLMRMKKEKDAIKTLNNAIQFADLDSASYAEVLTLRGDLYQQTNKWKLAEKDYLQAIQFNPQNAGALNNLAYMFSQQNRKLDSAYEMSKKAIEIDENNTSFLDTYAYILYLQGKYSEAKVFFRQAISQGGNKSAVLLDHYADTLYKLGEYGTAEIYWSQALEQEDCVNPKEIKKKLQKLRK